MTVSRITWQAGNDLPALGKKVAERKRLIRAGILQIAQEFALLIQGWAQENRKWKDRTANARQGITGKAIPLSETQIMVILFHQMSYGLWLEIRRSFAGRYAILLTSMRQHYPSLMRELKAFLGD